MFQSWRLKLHSMTNGESYLQYWKTNDNISIKKGTVFQTLNAKPQIIQTYALQPEDCYASSQIHNYYYI
jgi:hypothetical protein